MANLVKSVFTITFDKDGPHEVVLITAGELMEEHWKGLDAHQETEAGDYIEADDSEPMARGHTKRTVEFTAHKTHATAEDALEYCFSADLAITDNYRASLTVARPGGATYTLANCVFKRWNIVHCRPNHLRTAASYSLECGALALGTTGPTGPDPVGLEGGLINVTGAAGTLDAGDASADHGEEVATWQNSGTGVALTNATGGERPKLLGRNGLYLPGTAGNYVNWPDDPSLEMTSTWAVEFNCWLPSYRPASAVCLVGKWTEAGDQRGFRVMLNPDGTVTADVSTDGTAATITSLTSTTPLPLGSGEALRLGVSRSATTMAFLLYQEDFSLGGMVLGDVLTGLSALTPFNGTAALNVGATEAGTADLLEGVVERVRLWRSSTIDSFGLGGQLFFTSPFLAATQVPQTGGPVLTTPGIMRSGTDSSRMVFAPVLRFDGSDDSLEMATPAALNAVGGVTLAWHGTLNSIAGTQDLVFCANNGTGIRVLLRANGSAVELHVRRDDAEAVAVISYPGAFTAYLPKLVIAAVDFANGIATIYLDGYLKQSGNLTSAGVTSATDSTETRIMAGQGGSNFARGEVNHVYLAPVVTPFTGIADLNTTILELSR
jgi:hypothetical protein